MAATGPNLPLVIQQAGDVSRVQETVQRLGEQQQATALNQAQEREKVERTQVQKSEPSDGQNRVKADADGHRQQEHRREKRRRKQQAEQSSQPGPAPRGGGLLVNKVV